MSADVQLAAQPHGFTAMQYAICLKGIVWREALRFLHQRERFVAALVRPLVWLFIFAAGAACGAWLAWGLGWNAAVRLYRDRDINRAQERAEADRK